jgi:hypothetical protein
VGLREGELLGVDVGLLDTGAEAGCEVGLLVD